MSPHRTKSPMSVFIVFWLCPHAGPWEGAVFGGDPRYISVFTFAGHTDRMVSVKLPGTLGLNERNCYFEGGPSGPIRCVISVGKARGAKW